MTLKFVFVFYILFKQVKFCWSCLICESNKPSNRDEHLHGTCLYDSRGDAKVHSNIWKKNMISKEILGEKVKKKIDMAH